jgi:hypothetical protein
MQQFQGERQSMSLMHGNQFISMHLLETKCLPPSFRQIPTFGSSTIRRFANNVCGMKKLAARDFEDILQVWYLPSFSGSCQLI